MMRRIIVNNNNVKHVFKEFNKIYSIITWTEFITIKYVFTHDRRSKFINHFQRETKTTSNKIKI